MMKKLNIFLIIKERKKKMIRKVMVIVMIFLGVLFAKANDDVSIADLKEVTYYLLNDVDKNKLEFEKKITNVESSILTLRVNSDKKVEEINSALLEHKKIIIILNDIQNYSISQKLLDYYNSKK